MQTIKLEEHSVKYVPISQTGSSIEYWDVKKFKKKLNIKVVNVDKEDMSMEFDLINIGTPFVNAFRRVLLSEVPTMAIEKVHVYNNTSIIQDEILAHRLGLVPLKADPRKFSFPKNLENDAITNPEECLEFQLKVTCKRNAKLSTRSTDDDFRDCKNTEVHSNLIKWVPIGEQALKFKPEDVEPIHDNILVAKLRPGHELDLKLIAVKGIGKDHAKFQPVATASYRLLPQITLEEVVQGEKAQRLKASFSPGVVKLTTENNIITAKINNPRYDSCSRNVFQHEDLKDIVKISRVPNHYIFTIESVGALSPNTLFLESIQVLRGKCDKLLSEIKAKGKNCFL
ncbi:hypothetical protein V9T40_003092 [Parthenolecanium corni]|uniref:DNA-directed RNA polymerases I and III subunit RPAC1 n=1 Tax=Parthenolecanium corni TaxID=536013 RepID=A0AAN9Y7P6_9HEMI